jgi:hypothetical protein
MPIVKVSPLLSCTNVQKRLKQTVAGTKVNSMLLLLSRQMAIMLKEIDECKPSANSKILLHCVDSLFSEIEAFFTKIKSSNLLVRYFQSQLNGSKVLLYSKSINGLMEKLQIKFTAIDKELQEAFHKDHSLLTGIVEQILLDLDLNVKDKVGKLGIISSSTVDTLEVLRVGAKNSLPSIVEQLEIIQKYLNEKSGRKVEERLDFMMISAHDIQYLQDTPIGNGSFGDVYLGNYFS